MKNKDYLRTCTDNELAEVIAAMVINTVETISGEPTEQFAVEAEIYAISEWLNTEMVAGDYLN